MLKQRIITAVILLALFIPALAHPSPLFFAALTLLLIAAAGWEWARMQGKGAALSWFSGLAMAAVLGLLMLSAVNLPWRTVWLLAAGAWVLLAVKMLSRGVAGWAVWPALLRWVLGSLLIVLAGMALWQARGEGRMFLLSVLCLVWTADVAAYFGGKRWGKRKLAPQISPGKTWAGALSGLVGVLLLASVWLVVESLHPTESPSLYARLWTFGPLLAVLALVFLTTMAVVGDLVESLVKRSAGVKDSSAMLPGHGGVLDRVDALLPVLPLVMMLALV